MSGDRRYSGMHVIGPEYSSSDEDDEKTPAPTQNSEQLSQIEAGERLARELQKEEDALYAMQLQDGVDKPYLPYNREDLTQAASASSAASAAQVPSASGSERHVYNYQASLIPHGSVLGVEIEEFTRINEIDSLLGEMSDLNVGSGIRIETVVPPQAQQAQQITPLVPVGVISVDTVVMGGNSASHASIQANVNNKIPTGKLLFAHRTSSSAPHYTFMSRVRMNHRAPEAPPQERIGSSDSRSPSPDYKRRKLNSPRAELEGRGGKSI